MHRDYEPDSENHYPGHNPGAIIPHNPFSIKIRIESDSREKFTKKKNREKNLRKNSWIIFFNILSVENEAIPTRG